AFSLLGLHSGERGWPFLYRPYRESPASPDRTQRGRSNQGQIHTQAWSLGTRLVRGPPHPRLRHGTGKTNQTYEVRPLDPRAPPWPIACDRASQPQPSNAIDADSHSARIDGRTTRCVELLSHFPLRALPCRIVYWCVQL